jgi:hypothetical protein
MKLVSGGAQSGAATQLSKKFLLEYPWRALLHCARRVKLFKPINYPKTKIKQACCT